MRCEFGPDGANRQDSQNEKLQPKTRNLEIQFLGSPTKNKSVNHASGVK